MPTATRSAARPVRRTAPGHTPAERRESIAAFEQWQRNWSTSRQTADANATPVRTDAKRDHTARSAPTSR